MQDCKPISKIGILSMQRVPNYGSFLQAFALFHTIKKIRPDADILFVDIKPGRLLHGKLRHSIDRFETIIKGNIFHFIQKCLFVAKQRRFMFREYQQKYLNIADNEHNWDILFDTVVVGSDEVFSCLQKTSWGFSKNLLGEGLIANNVITYAASCGATTVSGVEAISYLPQEVEKAFQNIKQFSVRDENTYRFVKRFANKEASVNVDPVFLFDFDKYIPITNLLDHNFVLIYSYIERFNKKEEIIAIREFAKTRGLKTISVFGYQSWCDKNLILNPFEVLAYFKQASYIITDTFHGTIFSIKYNKPFVSFVRNNTNKLHYLLEIFELQNREVNNLDILSEKLMQEINYNYVNRIIDRQIQMSLSYLEQYL